MNVNLFGQIEHVLYIQFRNAAPLAHAHTSQRKFGQVGAKFLHVSGPVPPIYVCEKRCQIKLNS